MASILCAYVWLLLHGSIGSSDLELLSRPFADHAFFLLIKPSFGRVTHLVVQLQLRSKCSVPPLCIASHLSITLSCTHPRKVPLLVSNFSQIYSSFHLNLCLIYSSSDVHVPQSIQPCHHTVHVHVVVPRSYYIISLV